jgi:hypothetical protein
MLSEEGACYPHRNYIPQKKQTKSNTKDTLKEKNNEPQIKKISYQMAQFSGVIGIQINS